MREAGAAPRTAAQAATPKNHTGRTAPKAPRGQRGSTACSHAEPASAMRKLAQVPTSGTNRVATGGLNGATEPARQNAR